MVGYHPEPLCFVRWPAFAEETKPIGPNYSEVLQKQRICPRFVRWDYGFDPKEHGEMNFQKSMEARRNWASLIGILLLVIAGVVTAIVAGRIQRPSDVRDVTVQPANITINIPEQQIPDIIINVPEPQSNN